MFKPISSVVGATIAGTVAAGPPYVNSIAATACRVEIQNEFEVVCGASKKYPPSKPWQPTRWKQPRNNPRPQNLLFKQDVESAAVRPNKQESLDLTRLPKQPDVRPNSR